MAIATQITEMIQKVRVCLARLSGSGFVESSIIGGEGISFFKNGNRAISSNADLVRKAFTEKLPHSFPYFALHLKPAILR